MGVRRTVGVTVRWSATVWCNTTLYRSLLPGCTRNLRGKLAREVRVIRDANKGTCTGSD